MIGNQLQFFNPIRSSNPIPATKPEMSTESDQTLSPLNPNPEELTRQIQQMLRTKISNIQQPSRSPEKITLNMKLNGENYLLWARLMRVEIWVKGRTDHITGETRASAATDLEFLRWEQEDLRVFSWILQNIEPNLINRVSIPDGQGVVGCPGRHLRQWERCPADL